jgi:hypothetical protein
MRTKADVRQCLRICVYAQASTLGWRSALACVIETLGPRGDDVTIRMAVRGRAFLTADPSHLNDTPSRH